MAYLTSLEHDIFISYAHVDNVPDREGEKGWVERFERQLTVRLLKRFGEPVDVWRDPELGRAQRFDPVIEKAVRGAGVVIALITPRYLKSDYCRQELAWFCEQAKAEPGGLIVDNYLRIFPVLLYNIPPNEWPDACKGTSAFAFHDAENADDYGSPLDPNTDLFEKQLKNLVEELNTVLTLLQKATPQAPVEAAEKPDETPSFSIFMALPPDELGPTQRQLSTALKRNGIQVVTHLPPPYEEAEHTAAVNDAFRKINLSVHLLSTQPGEPLYEETPCKTYPCEQVRLALDHPHPKLILLPEEFAVEDIADAAYVEFINMLRERPRATDGFELVQTGRHQMLDEILAKKRNIEEEAHRLQVASAANGATAFIDLHTSDIVNATDLVGYLAEKHFVPLMIPSADLSPSAGMSLFEENLKKAALFIVVFGTVARNWVEHRLNEAFKLILSNRLSTRIGVYLAPPSKPATDVLFPPLFTVANNMTVFDPKTLEQLLQKPVAA